MNRNEERFKYLFDQYVNRTSSKVEFKEFFSLVKSGEYRETLQRLMDDTDKIFDINKEVTDIDWDRMYNQITAPDKVAKSKIVRLIPYMAAAAVLLCVIGFAFYFANIQKGKPDETLVHNNLSIDVPEADSVTDVDPGTDKAVIQLADGTEIELNDHTSGLLASQGSTKVSKGEEGVLIYQPQNGIKEDKVLYNTLRTPIGGTYMLVLPDKSKAWLNAASTITFPNRFDGKERHVRITGEVYFEIAKSVGQTFTVSTDKGNVTVLGTHFNVMSYPDEPSEEVTLLEGSIRLSSGNTKKTLAPGQMAVYNGTGPIGIKKLEFPDTKIDWQKGLFQFENESLEKIMQRVARWYDVKVVFSGNSVQKHFTGTIPRDEKVSGILNLLKKSGNFQYEIHEKTIIIKQ